MSRERILPTSLLLCGALCLAGCSEEAPDATDADMADVPMSFFVDSDARDPLWDALTITPEGREPTTRRSEGTTITLRRYIERARFTAQVRRDVARIELVWDDAVLGVTSEARSAVSEASFVRVGTATLVARAFDASGAVLGETSRSVTFVLEPLPNHPPDLTYATDAYQECFAETCTELVSGRDLYLAPADGSAGAGTAADPYRDLSVALAALRPGDTLHVGAGVYRLPRLAISNLHGERCAPIRVVGPVEGGQAIFTPAIPDFDAPTATTWIERIAPNGVRYYVSALRLDSLGRDAHQELLTWGSTVYGFMNLDGRDMQLIPYRNEAELLSPHTRIAPSDADDADDRLSTVPLYVGPGVAMDPRECLRHMIDAGLYRPEDAGFVRRMTPADRAAFDALVPGEDACRVRVRLEDTPRQRVMGYPVDDPNPAHHPLRIALNGAFDLSRSTYLTIERIHFEAFHDLEASLIQHVDLANNRWLVRNVLRVRSGERTAEAGVHHVFIRNSEYSQAFPPYLFWSDLKWGYTSDAGVANSGCVGPAGVLCGGDGVSLHRNVGEGIFAPSCVSFQDNRAHDVWLGFSASGHRNFVIHNRVERAHDDAIVTYVPSSSYVEVAYNEVFDSYSGISQIVSGDPTPIPEDATLVRRLFVHHNVVDVVRSGLFPIAVRRDPESATEAERTDPTFGHSANLAVFIGHGSSTDTAWQHYNNTYVGGSLSTPSTPSVQLAMNDGGATRGHFVNNIVVNRSGRPLIRRANMVPEVAAPGSTRGTLADGNIYWVDDGRPEYTCIGPACCASLDLTPHVAPNAAFVSYAYDQTASGTLVFASYASLAHWRCPSGRVRDLVSGTRAWAILECAPGVSCEPGFDANSLYRDPQLDGDYASPGTARRVRVPEGYPDGDSSFVGACEPGRCTTGVRGAAGH